ncbi:MAG: bifunctional oligoribonuclease/PAP phosphatase NrnA [Clostridia bacterium]|nr:bifunctional oligoribonuclease/PAP phosphatase NrnA [Clostridia bacterium]
MRDPAGVSAAVESAGSVWIAGHVNPDGDAIGSALAMRLILETMGKRTTVFFQDKVPDDLAFLPGASEIRPPSEAGDSADLFLAVDTSSRDRLGSCEALMARCSRTAQIDHHGTNPAYAQVNSVDGSAAATGVLILEQMKALKVALTADVALCLYAAISTDTGNFSFDCTNGEVFRAMSELMEAGLPLAELNMRLFREKSRPQLKLLGRAIEHLFFAGAGRIAVMTLSRRDFEDCGALAEHADTIVNYGLETLGTWMALLARENGDGTVKFSLRARAPLTVDDVAESLGGGGHPRAAGISIPGILEETTRRVVEAMEARLERETDLEEER